MHIATRSFSVVDQQRFASASGDHNPMHVDELYARRTQAGAPVVHGIHLLLWALDSFAATAVDLPELRSIRANFNKFVYVGDEVEVSLGDERRGPSGVERMRLVLSAGGIARSKMTLEFGAADCRVGDWVDSLLAQLPSSSAPGALAFDEMRNQSGAFQFAMSARSAHKMFPAASAWLGAAGVAALAASSQLVGMICPGLHSIYSELRLRACTPPRERDEQTESATRLGFRVIETDPRFRSVMMEIAGGGWSGTVDSTARLPPVQQASMASLAREIDGREFVGSAALIVGGSRGLGELTAKAIAVGGGRVCITYHAGGTDAERVAGEIRAAGGLCDVIRYDVREPAAPQLAQLAWSPSHAYYFATPVIFQPQAALFSAVRLAELLSFYVEGFWRLSTALNERCEGVRLFYPSTVYVEERPQGLLEYAMSKAAGEVLCNEINGTSSPVRVLVKRLPRLLTDQTASTTATSPDAMATLLPILREMQGAQSAALHRE